MSIGGLLGQWVFCHNDVVASPFLLLNGIMKGMRTTDKATYEPHRDPKDHYPRWSYRRLSQFSMAYNPIKLIHLFTTTDSYFLCSTSTVSVVDKVNMDTAWLW
jgi:hypothetical protein